MKKLLLTIFVCTFFSLTQSFCVEFEFRWNISDMSTFVGLETDGEYFYSCRWNGAGFRIFNKTGGTVDTFVISGVTNIRDLAYDGQYFY